MNGCIGSENLTCSYFRTRLAPSPIHAIILTHNHNPFRDSLRSSQYALITQMVDFGGVDLTKVVLNTEAHPMRIG